MIIKCYEFEVEGVVQGVGFRPFVYSLALKYNLLGYVLNHSWGVRIVLEGDIKNIEKFEKALLKELPPLSRIDKLEKKSLHVENFKEFSIKKSENLTSKYSLVSPDFSMCEDCLKELRDKNNRRYNYFFINCTNSGPRYSIEKSVPYD